MCPEAQRGWDRAILKASRREKPSAVEELPHLKGEVQDGIMDNQAHELTNPILLQNVTSQQCLEHVKQKDDQDVVDCENYNRAE